MQVGAVIDPVRRQRVALAVARQEGDAGVAQMADPQRPGRRAVGGVTVQGLFVFQRRQPVDAGAANHRQGDVHRIQALSA